MPLPDRFKDQLEFLRDAPAIKAVVTEFLQRPEFEDPARFDDAAAGFLQAAAAVVPEQVAEILARVIESASDDDLSTTGFLAENSYGRSSICYGQRRLRVRGIRSLAPWQSTRPNRSQTMPPVSWSTAFRATSAARLCPTPPA